MADIGDLNHEENILVRRLELDLEDTHLTRQEIVMQQTKITQQVKRYEIELMKTDKKIELLKKELELHKKQGG